MKKYLIILAALFIQEAGKSQTMFASVGAGVDPTLAGPTLQNKIMIYMKCNQAKTENISTCQFNVAIPQATCSLAQAPVLVADSSYLPTSFTSSWQIYPPYLEGGYYNYNIIFLIYPVLTTVPNVEFKALQVRFTNGPNGSFANTAHIICLPDGGINTGNALFYYTSTLKLYLYAYIYNNNIVLYLIQEQIIICF